MKKLLCVFTLLTLVSVAVYAESKKDIQIGSETFTEEQVKNVYNLILRGNSINKELTNLLTTVMEEKMTPNMGEQYSETRLKRFFDNDPYGIKKYAETSTALIDTYEGRCINSKIDKNQTKASTTDAINWEVEKTKSEVSPDVVKGGGSKIYRTYVHTYSFGIECPDGRVYEAIQICFMTAEQIRYVYTPEDGKEKFVEYIDCNISRVNINGR